MPKSSIKKEMLNKDGKIKESIKELVKLNGAYIIACSGDSLSDKRKNERIFLAANHLLNMSENIKKKEGKYYGIKKGVPRNIKSA